MAAEDITNVGQLQDLIANLPRAMSISPVFYIEPDGNEPGVCYHGCEVQEDTFGKYKFLAILVSLDGPFKCEVCGGNTRNENGPCDDCE